MVAILIIFLYALSTTRGDYINLDEAKENLYLAYSSYCEPQPIGMYDCYWCNQTAFVNVTFVMQNASTNTFGWVGFQGNRVIVSFRGTRRYSALNWMENLDTLKTIPWPTIRPDVAIHAGFWSAYLGLEDQLPFAIRKTLTLCPSCNHIMYVGHSLGGALASIAAVDIRLHMGIDLPAMVYTFGQPRVGNKKFVELFENTVFRAIRMVCMRDPVAHLPVELFGFYHTPLEIWEKIPLQFTICDNTGEDNSCSDSLYAPVYVGDHFLYLSANYDGGHLFGC